MKVSLVGDSGYLAKYLFNRFSKEHIIESVIKIGRNTDSDLFIDLNYAKDFDYSLLDEIDYVIFTAGISSPDKCANEFDYSWRVNVIGTNHFINEAVRRKCRVVFFSSDAVFGEDSNKIFNEESNTEAKTPYGKMKKAVEDMFYQNKYFKSIRLPYVASAKDKFYNYLFNCISNNTIAEIYHPFYRNVTVVSDVVDTVMYLITQWDTFNHSFLDVAGPELVSRIRMADELNRIVNGKLKYNIVMPDETFFLNRPRITQMESLYLSKYNIINGSSFTEKIFKELEVVKL